MKLRLGHLLTAAGVLATASVAQAAFIVESVSTGKAFTNFSFGGTTTSASGSSAKSFAVGLTGTSSVFSGNGTASDTYVFSYTPGTDADNTVYTPGQVLGDTAGNPGDGNTASGLTGGVSGQYRVYFTAPESTNISTTGSDFTITQDGTSIQIDAVNMNNGGTGPDTNASTAFTGGLNNAWELLGSVNLTAGTTYTVTIDSNSTAFTSQRASGVMWELQPVPEPTSLALFGLAGAALLGRRRRGA